MENEIYSFKKLCIYCFDVLLNHLNNSKKEAIFPEEFKGVNKNLIKNLEILSTFCNLVNRSRKRLKRLHRHIF